MTLYVFNRVPTEEERYSDGIDLSMGDAGVYAATVEKDLYKRFKEERNMNFFRVHKIEGSKEECKKFLIENSGARLDIHDLQTKSKSGNGLYSSGYAPVLCTYNEYSACDSDFYEPQFTNPSFWIDSTPSGVYKKKLKEALDYIQYDINMRIFSSTGPVADFLDTVPYEDIDYYIDELEVFIGYFGFLFN